MEASHQPGALPSLLAEVLPRLGRDAACKELVNKVGNSIDMLDKLRTSEDAAAKAELQEATRLLVDASARLTTLAGTLLRQPMSDWLACAAGDNEAAQLGFIGKLAVTGLKALSHLHEPPDGNSAYRLGCLVGAVLQGHRRLVSYSLTQHLQCPWVVTEIVGRVIVDTLGLLHGHASERWVAALRRGCLRPAAVLELLQDLCRAMPQMESAEAAAAAGMPPGSKAAVVGIVLVEVVATIAASSLFKPERELVEALSALKQQLMLQVLARYLQLVRRPAHDKAAWLAQFTTAARVAFLYPWLAEGMRGVLPLACPTSKSLAAQQCMQALRGAPLSKPAGVDTESYVVMQACLCAGPSYIKMMHYEYLHTGGPLMDALGTVLHMCRALAAAADAAADARASASHSSTVCDDELAWGIRCAVLAAGSLMTQAVPGQACQAGMCWDAVQAALLAAEALVRMVGRILHVDSARHADEAWPWILTEATADAAGLLGRVGPLLLQHARRGMPGAVAQQALRLAVTASKVVTYASKTARCSPGSLAAQLPAKTWEAWLGLLAQLYLACITPADSQQAGDEGSTRLDCAALSLAAAADEVVPLLLAQSDGSSVQELKQRMLGPLLPALAWTEQTQQRGSSSAAEAEAADLRRARALSLRACANLACTHLSGASEAECRGRRCSGCRLVRFCSRACSVAAWPSHKAACRVLAAQAAAVQAAHAPAES